MSGPYDYNNSGYGHQQQGGYGYGQNQGGYDYQQQGGYGQQPYGGQAGYNGAPPAPDYTGGQQYSQQQVGGYGGPPAQGGFNHGQQAPYGQEQ